ncbi:TIGR00266 family protein [Blastopirellula marina]|uniref:TIGR00266 family protein n=1 Tax=Blastopirellula marina DSM 3645 TaxID=314230 RepID=A3ZPZ8_9BACT|nr:TIGR00266 family protein [Blastopirellula marina]EAQ81271.1 hypothetical protein DSM3645_22806 [Blastopirellula marina DSM 3645]
MTLPVLQQHSHDIDYHIIGDDMQLVEVELDPGETVIAEAGAMNYMQEGITFSTKMGDGSDPDQGLVGKLFSAGKRMVSGNSLFMGHFTNESSTKRHVAFGAPYPGKILPIELSEIGGTLTCQKDSFLCAAMGTRLDIAFQKRLGAGFFGGEGFILQHLTGDGNAFLHACGAIITRELKGETLLVEAGSLVAFTQGIDYDIERAGNLKSMLLGGEGLYLAKLSGHGTVMMQSLPFSRMANHILARAGGKG